MGEFKVAPFDWKGARIRAQNALHHIGLIDRLSPARLDSSIKLTTYDDIYDYGPDFESVPVVKEQELLPEQGEQ